MLHLQNSEITGTASQLAVLVTIKDFLYQFYYFSSRETPFSFLLFRHNNFTNYLESLFSKNKFQLGLNIYHLDEIEIK